MQSLWILSGKSSRCAMENPRRAEKFRDSGKQADRADVVLAGLRQQRLHQKLATSRTLTGGIDSDRSDLRQVRPVEVKGAATDNIAAMFQHNEVAHILANLGEGSRQQEFRLRNKPQSERVSAPHREEGLHACAWIPSRRDSTFFLASVKACRTRAGAVPPGTSWIFSTACNERLE